MPVNVASLDVFGGARRQIESLRAQVTISTINRPNTLLILLPPLSVFFQAQIATLELIQFRKP